MGHLPVTPYTSASSAVDLISIETASESDCLEPRSLFSTLRRAVSERSHQVQEILSGVAHSARILTAAQGVAIALAEDETVACKPPAVPSALPLDQPWMFPPVFQEPVSAQGKP